MHKYTEIYYIEGLDEETRNRKIIEKARNEEENTIRRYVDKWNHTMQQRIRLKRRLLRNTRRWVVVILIFN